MNKGLFLLFLMALAGPAMAKPFGLVLFYGASCPHCQRFDPIVKHYAVAHQLPVLAYTIDGSALPSFPDSVSPSPEETRRFFPHGGMVVPTLFLIDGGAKTILPVLKGEASAEQLARRIEQLTRGAVR